MVTPSLTLTTAESDAIVSVMLNFLQENPATDWGDYHYYENNSDKLHLEYMDRGGAAMLLSVLYDFPATSSSAKERIRQQENLIVDYYLSDYDHWGCAPTTLDVYLTNKL